MRRYDGAGADPFLQASNLVAEIMEDGCPHAHTILEKDAHCQTKNTHRG